MTIWVKEYEGVFLFSGIHFWIKKGLNIKQFSSFDVIDPCDILILSKRDELIHSIQENVFTILYYEEFSEKIVHNITRELQYNFDFYHLKNALKEAQSSDVTTIISGSSYGLLGIERSLLQNEVNLSLTSQDLYYSVKGIYATCEANKNIRNIVLCCGYYYFFSDLSRTQNQGEILRVAKVYNPLFNDVHNCNFLPPKEEILFRSNIFDVSNILDVHSARVYQNGFFNESRRREYFGIKEWSDPSKKWHQLTELERNIAAENRTTFHNKLIKRTSSLAENIQIFNNLCKFCEQNSINLLLVVAPASVNYLSRLHPEYKNIFYQVINGAPGVLHLLDFCDSPMFCDEDFIDTDHLGDSGAEKMTQLILSTLQEINS